LEQNAFLPPAGESKPDWEIMCLVAKALGLSGRLSQAEHAAEKAVIIEQMHTVFSEKNQQELGKRYSGGVVPAEAIITGI
jgi:anaerobic selenocysteine-containing dehydrogenase